jgi:hypothetical protein
MIWRWPSQITDGMWTVLYWTRSSRTQFGVSINVWRLEGDTLNITCDFLYCNHQVHRHFLIALYHRLVSTYTTECIICASIFMNVKILQNTAQYLCLLVYEWGWNSPEKLTLFLLVNVWLMLKFFRTPYSISVCGWWMRLKCFRISHSIRACETKNEADILKISHSICAKEFTNEAEILQNTLQY